MAIEAYVSTTYALDCFGKMYSTSLYGDKLTDIIAFVSRIDFTAGVRSDGTVAVATIHKEYDTSSWKLFNNFDNIEEERKAKMVQDVPVAAQYRAQGLCQHCGGTFKGMFTKKCSACGKEKDY